MNLSVEVVAVAEPDAEAAALAAARGAEIVRDRVAAEAAVAKRRESPAAPVDDEGIAELRQLAEELSRAQRIRDRTHEGLREAISQRLGQTGAVTVHPASIRLAAATIVEAERDLASAEERLAVEDLSIAPGATTDAQAREAERSAPARTERELAAILHDDKLDRRRAKVIGWSLSCAAIGTGLVLFALGLGAIVSVAVATAGVAIAVTLSLRATRAISAVAQDAEHERDTTVDVSPSVEDIDDDPPSSAVNRRTIELDRSRAAERLRAATRQWETLVGHDVDPHDVDAVLRARDAQFDIAAASAVSPTIKAVSTLHRRSSARWLVAWAALGYEGPPSMDRLEAELERLRTGSPRPLLLVEPARWLPAEELAGLLRELPDGTSVTIVQRGQDPGDGGEGQLKL